MGKMLFNNQILERENVVNIEDRGYQFGDGVYEVIGVYDSKLFMMDEHLERLKRSANEIHLKFPYQMDNFRKNLEELVAANNLEEGIVYLQVSRGAGPRWHEFPDPDVSPVIVAYTRAEDRMTDLEEKGGTAVLTEDIRWLRCDIKTLNLLPNVLAKQKAVENNAVEAILHRGDIVTEASASNVFMVKDGELYTHPANNYILNGITRQKILERCGALDIKVNEETFTVDEMLAADEIFVTATKSDIIPILKIDNQEIGAGVPGTTTFRILEEFRSLIRELAKT